MEREIDAINTNAMEELVFLVKASIGAFRSGTACIFALNQPAGAIFLEASERVRPSLAYSVP